MHEVNHTALNKWVDWRSKSKYGPLSSFGITRVYNGLRRMGPAEVQLSAVEQSINHGWQGLFVPRGTFAVQIDLSGVDLG
jgi:hypothetical protein